MVNVPLVRFLSIVSLVLLGLVAYFGALGIGFAIGLSSGNFLTWPFSLEEISAIFFIIMVLIALLLTVFVWRSVETKSVIGAPFGFHKAVWVAVFGYGLTASLDHLFNHINYLNLGTLVIFSAPIIATLPVLVLFNHSSTSIEHYSEGAA